MSLEPKAVKPWTPERIRKLSIAHARKMGKENRNQPPWGKPMTAVEYVDAHEGWTTRLKESYGFVSARNDEEVFESQCGGCRFYMPIEGGSGADWGACGNPVSDRIGTVVFEHHGCPVHSNGQPEWSRHSGE